MPRRKSPLGLETHAIVNRLCEAIDDERRAVEDALEKIELYYGDAAKNGIVVAQRSFKHSMLLLLLDYFLKVLTIDEVKQIMTDDLMQVLRERDNISKGKPCHHDPALLNYKYTFLMTALEEDYEGVTYNFEHLMGIMSQYDPFDSLAEALLSTDTVLFLTDEVDQESDVY